MVQQDSSSSLPLGRASVRGPSGASGIAFRPEPANDVEQEPSLGGHATTWTRPSDWPEPGAIDLAVHDRPHSSSDLEWWYVNTQLLLIDGRSVGVFAAFFRQRRRKTGQYTHFVAWGISNADAGVAFSKVAVDSLAAEVGLENLETGLKGDDERVERALKEVLAKGRLPSPTTQFDRDARVARATLDLDYDGAQFQKDEKSGIYRLRLRDAASGMACDLRLELMRTPIRYGRDGTVSGVGGEVMFYYFVPRAAASGIVTIDGVAVPVETGQGWYDHEFGVRRPEAELRQAARGAAGETCWRWLSLQFDGGTELSVYYITRRATQEVLDSWAMLSRPDGTSAAFSDVELETLENWRSTRTFIEYPVAFRIAVPSADIQVFAKATFPDQEVITVISDPAFWEGTIRASGRIEGNRVLGQGWLECKGFGHSTLDSFYGSVGREVRERLNRELPRVPGSAALRHLMVRGSGNEPATDWDVDPARLGESLVAPIRAIADRGGKAWRSYAALVCIDAVGGDSRKFLHWLIQPEIVHVGSLIVDDVEDASEVRRGGPSCHLLYGTPTAINAGTAAYFLAEPPLDHDALSDTEKLRIYRWFFDAMRAGHAGQALDLHDVTALAARAARSGDVTELERHVLGVHRLKTAVPAACFARTGALLGGGSEEQITRVGDYFEAVGLAFQIVDDVLNVSGFRGELKQRGEDIRAGKFTLPIVRALARSAPQRRQWLWRSVASQPTDEQLVQEVGMQLFECGALTDCRAQAEQLVVDAWRRLDPVLEDSQYKLSLRAFGWYVLERHY
jgi:geranylgeranyl pyrophosphate synthase/predicted secreted hydrolase